MKAQLVALTLLLSLTGCVSEETLKPDIELAKSLVADLQARNFDAIEGKLDRAVWGDSPRDVLVKMAELLPATPPSAIEVAGWGIHVVKMVGEGSTRRVTVSLQYRFDDKWLVAAAQWRRKDDGPILIEGIQLQPLPASLEEINRFTLAGRSAVHYAVLSLAIALPIFSIAVLVLCLRTPMHWFRKTLWALAILFGVPALHFNWTSGAIVWRAFYFHLLSGGYTKSGLGPTILTVALPLGAIIFLLRRPSLMRAPATGEACGGAGEDRASRGGAGEDRA